MSKLYKFSFLIICSTLLIGCVSQEPVISDFKDKKPQEIYITAEKNFRDEYYNEAIRDFRGLIQFYQFNDYTERAYIKLINCYIKVEQFADAIKKANEFARLYPRSSWLKEIQYLQRKILEKAKEELERKKGSANSERFVNAIGIISTALNPSVRYYPTRFDHHRYERALEEYEAVLEEYEEGLRSKKHFKEKN